MEDFHYYLFRLQQLGGKDHEHNTVLILTDSENLPTPCPGIMRQKDIDTALRGELPLGKRFAHAVIPFSPRNGFSVRYRVGVLPQIIPTDPKQLINGHRIEILDKFPLNSIREISTVAKERGGVSFIINDRKEMARTVRGLFKSAAKDFKYVECFGQETNAYGPENMGDDLALSITLMDLPYCIPIYDTRRLDGVGLIASLFYPKSTEKKGDLRYHDIFALVLSNYADNIFKIDGGSKINKRSGIPGGLVEHLTKTIRTDAQKAKSEGKSNQSGSVPKTKAKKAKSAGGIVTRQLRGTPMSTYYASTSSSTDTTSTW
jgi:hypothetical protein